MGPTSVSCNSLFLYDGMMECQSKIKSNGNLCKTFKKKYFAQKENLWLLFEKRQFTSKFDAVQRLNKTKNPKS